MTCQGSLVALFGHSFLRVSSQLVGGCCVIKEAADAEGKHTRFNRTIKLECNESRVKKRLRLAGGASWIRLRHLPPSIPGA